MKIEVHKNENHDLLVTVSDRSSEMEDRCFGVDKRWMDSKDKDSYIEDWYGQLIGKIESHAGRALSSNEKGQLTKACESAVVTDGIAPKD